MAFVPALISGLGALGGLFGNRGTRQEQGGTSQQNSTVTMGSTTGTGFNPTLDPRAQTGYSAISDMYMKLMGQDPDLKGYEASQGSDITHMAELRKQAMAQNLAQRGISGPAAFNAMNTIDNSRFADLTKLHQGIPLLARNIQENTLGNAGNFYRGMPVGSVTESQTGSTTNEFGNTAQQGNMQQSGNMLGGLFGNLAPLLAQLYGMGVFNRGSGGDMSQGAGY